MKISSCKFFLNRFFGKTIAATAFVLFVTGANCFAGFLATNNDIFVQTSKNIYIVKQSGSTLTTTASFASGNKMSGDWILRSSTDRFGPIADFDGDGKDEVFVASKWGVGVVKATGTTFTSFGLAPNNYNTNGGWKLNTFTNQFGPAADFNGDGRAEILFSSPWGIGVAYYSNGSLYVNLMVQNETRISGLWVLDTKHDHLGPVGDFDGDGHPEFLISSPWGMAIMKYTGSAFASLSVVKIVKNGTVFPGGWTLNTADNRFAAVGKFDGDGTRQEILVTSSQGIGILKYSNGDFSVIASVPNGTRMPGGWIVSSTDNQFGPVGDFDGDKTTDEFIVSSAWGIASVKLAGSTLTSSAMTQNGTRLSGGWIVDTKTNHFGPVGNFDNGSQSEMYVTSPWGMSFFKLSSGALTSPVIAANGSGFGGWTVNTIDNRVSFGLTTFSDLADWLAKNPRIASAIQFQKQIAYNGASSFPYTQWTDADKADLQTAFRNAELGQSITLADPPANQLPEANNSLGYTILSITDAWSLYCAHIANSLCLEINQSLWWSLQDYNDANLATILNSTSFFMWDRNTNIGDLIGYDIALAPGWAGEYGWALPAPPAVVNKFIADNSIVGASRVATITNLLQWCRTNLYHFVGNPNLTEFNRVWQYRGVPPVSRILAGTVDPQNFGGQKHNFTAGCWGTGGFLRDVLRIVNIPAECPGSELGHCTPYFPSDNLYLDHGDAPYSGYVRTGAFNVGEILINSDTYASWFGSSVPVADRTKNVDRRERELAIQYLPTALLKFYCQDMTNNLNHSNGLVFEELKWPYTVTDLENMQLWTKMDAKIATLGGCDNIPAP